MEISGVSSYSVLFAMSLRCVLCNLCVKARDIAACIMDTHHVNLTKQSLQVSLGCVHLHVCVVTRLTMTFYVCSQEASSDQNTAGVCHRI